MDTAVSRVMMNQVEKLFDKYANENSKLYINSIIPENEQEEAQKAAEKVAQSKVKSEPKPQNNTQEPKIEKTQKQDKK